MCKALIVSGLGLQHCCGQGFRCRDVQSRIEIVDARIIQGFSGALCRDKHT